MPAKYIPYGRQLIEPDDIDAVVQVLQSDFLTQGPTVPKLESAISSFVGCEHSIMTNSATSALHVACMALGVGSGDWVWTSPNSFVASANCARFCGAEVDFVDIDCETGNLSIAALAEKLQQAKQKGCLPKAVIPVHYAGQSCDMQQIKLLADQFGFAVIEDASHALGASYQETKVGSCRFSDISVFSFHPVKMITAGEGGCLCTNDQQLAEKIRLLMNHGITKDPALFVQSHPEPWYYEQQLLGFNYRISELHAALALSQLSKLEHWVQVRNQRMQRYKKLTEHLTLHWLENSAAVVNSYHLAVIRVAAEKRPGLFEYLLGKNIGVQVHYIPIYKQPFYQGNTVNCPNAEIFYSEVISLPLFPALTDAQQDYSIACLEEFLL